MGDWCGICVLGVTLAQVKANHFAHLRGSDCLEDSPSRSDAAGLGPGDSAGGTGPVTDHVEMAGHPTVIIAENRFVGVHLDFRIVHDGAGMQDAGDNGVEFFHGRPEVAHDSGWHRQSQVAGRDPAGRREVVEIPVKGFLLRPFAHPEITNPLHQRLAATDFIGQSAEINRHLLATSDRVLEMDGLQKGDVDQIVAGLLSGEGVAVDQIKILVFLPDHPGMARVGAKGSDVIGKIDLRVVIIGDNRVALLLGLQADADIDDVIDVGYSHFFHDFLQKAETFAARGHDQFAAPDLLAVDDDGRIPVRFADIRHFGTQPDDNPEFLQSGQKAVDQLFALVGSDMGLADGNDLNTYPGRPLLISLKVTGGQDFRLQMIFDFFE